MKRIMLFIFLLFCTVSIYAQDKLILELNDGGSFTYNLSEVGRIDFTSSSVFKLIAKDESLMTSENMSSIKKLDFTENTQTAVESVKDNMEPSMKRIRKYVVDGQIVIETAEGKVYNMTGQQIK